MKVNKKNNLGFSLVEVVVVVGIFSASITAIYSLIWKNIYVQGHNQDFLVASMLAQEGLEMVRNIRDKNWLIDPLDNPLVSVFYGINGAPYTVDYLTRTTAYPAWPSPVTCNLATTPGDITDCSDCRLYINPSKYYGHASAGNTQTKYFRLIEVDSSIPNQLEVSSIVQWKENNAKREYIASTILYDWKQ